MEQEQNFLKIALEYLTKAWLGFKELGGMLLIFGFIGGIVAVIRNPEQYENIRFKVILTAGFVGWAFGSILIHYLNLSPSLIAPICSILGVFSKDILREVEEVIQGISEFIKNKMNNL